jgi:hypothetical protein
MKVLYIFLNICLPYYNFVFSTCKGTNGSKSISNSIILISFPNNLICGYISMTSIAEITSTFSYS